MDRIMDMLTGKKSACERCGAKELLEKVWVSAYHPAGRRCLTLCPRCRMAEKAKKY